MCKAIPPYTQPCVYLLFFLKRALLKKHVRLLVQCACQDIICILIAGVYSRIHVDDKEFSFFYLETLFVFLRNKDITVHFLETYTCTLYFHLLI